LKIYAAIQGMLEISTCKQSYIAGMLKQPVVDVQIALCQMKEKGLVERRDDKVDTLWGMVRKSKSGKLSLEMKELDVAEPVKESKVEEAVRLDPNGKIARDHAAMRSRLALKREAFWKKIQAGKGNVASKKGGLNG
jgi:predicted transcriptional regulator